MNLFQKADIILSSGKKSDFKIECDALTNEDWECLAYLISKMTKFKMVYGVPRGGKKLEKCLEKYCIEDRILPNLICDDVLTTGSSMNKIKSSYSSVNMIGVVIFARGKCPDWITPVFQMINI